MRKKRESSGPGAARGRVLEKPMPELPEVETIIKTLAPRLVGKTIRQARVARGDVIHPPGIDFGANVTGRTVSGLSRRGKRIIFELDDGRRFFIHLGMTGRLSLEKPSEIVLPHTHVFLEIDGAEVRFSDPRRFGGVWWLDQAAGDQGKFGPEPLTMRRSQLAAGLNKTRRAVKTALLDQSVVAGLGNIYADESLFEARIDPRTRALDLTDRQMADLTRAIKLILRRALRHRGSTLRDYRDADGNAGAFQKLHRVYDREGQPCPRCKTAITRIVLGGRSTHFCPKCQVAGRGIIRR
ncbi:MAG TPA: bifunctional DNA-formamidopyrimidine glycosylase/DNA-(apurinic or apyrimidinic site) lyase [Tepidisphaeraceae bacterium]|nr:bifunctional DNA-formamidopyrimidine glycosylase/DNA-(apurinic or apyrimidinic site) lyase [Tepidisphaeraceae bacterium]